MQKVGSQETPGVTGKFGLGVRNEAGQRLIEFCQENALVIANTLFQQHKRRLYTLDITRWSKPKSDWLYLISQRWRSPHSQQKVRNAVLGCNLKNNRMISVRFRGKPFNIMVIQAFAPSSNAEEAEVEQFYEDLQDLLELTSKKDVLFIIGDWNANVGSQETPGKSEVSQSCLTFCDPIDCSPPGSSVHGIF